MKRYFTFAGCGVIGFLFTLASVISTVAQTTSPTPVVSVVSPASGMVFHAPVNIQLIAKASVTSGTITNVIFFAGTKQLPGAAVSAVLDPPGVNGVTGPVYMLTWTNPPVGTVSITAQATDSDGVTGKSAPVLISVVQFGPVPVVRITSPPNLAHFFQPVNVPLFAFADAIYADAINDPFQAVSNVEFFANSIDLGPGHRVIVNPPPGTLAPTSLLPYDFTLVWSNAPAGNFALTAVATDSHGMTATSAPVNITIVPTMIVTNGPDVVSIVATDPVAVRGTNCWTWPGLPTPVVPTWAAWQRPVLTNYTNCGPKDATFTVCRAGDISQDLTVLYGISGSASNGVDYALLPGSVTIPAGQNYALINIVPLDDITPAAVQTVVLSLLPDSSASPLPGYVVGSPPRAAAIIVDGIPPRLATAVLPGGLFHLGATGPDGAWFCVEYTTDLKNWTPVCTNQVFNGWIDFVDSGGVTAGHRIYSAVPLTTAPTQ